MPRGCNDHYILNRRDCSTTFCEAVLNTMQVLEDDEEYQNPVDLLFEELAKKKPNSFAGRQYKLYKLAAGDICSK